VFPVNVLSELQDTLGIFRGRLWSAAKYRIVHLLEFPLDIAEPLFLICIAPRASVFKISLDFYRLCRLGCSWIEGADVIFVT
jgi:hypothetical protein